MMVTTTEKTKSKSQNGGKLPPEKAQIKTLSMGSVVRCRCTDCNLETEETAGQLVNAGIGRKTAAEYAAETACRRCGGELEASVDVA